MNADLTVKTKVLKLVYSDKDGSLRRGITNEIVSVGQCSLTIAHEDYTDAVTKVKGIRSVMRFQQDAANVTTGQPLRAYAQLTIGRPSDNTITDADILALIDCIRQLTATTAADANALNLASAFAVVREQ
jgi:hypothetical protein